jgi:hypothetical protein
MQLKGAGMMRLKRQTPDQLRRRLIRGVVLSAISFIAMAFVIGKRWNSNHTAGLIVGIAMMLAILIYVYCSTRAGGPANHA